MTKFARMTSFRTLSFPLLWGKLFGCIGLFIVVGGFGLSLAAGDINAAGFSFTDPVREFFGIVRATNDAAFKAGDVSASMLTIPEVEPDGTTAQVDAAMPMITTSTEIMGAISSTATSTPTPNVCDYCVIYFPASITVTTVSGASIYGRIYEAGVTDPPGADPSITAQVGIGPHLSDPRSAGGWTYSPATFNLQDLNNDEYVGFIAAPSVGTYSYVYRFSFDSGVNWTYADIDGRQSFA